jgi:5-methyltetrahydrofolate--homocysteine methyltransferase
LREVWKYNRATFFYQKILGYNRNIRIDLKRKEPKALKFVAEVREIEDEIIQYDLMKPKAVYQFYPGYSDGDDTVIETGSGELIFHFGRQKEEPFLCLSDFLAPKGDNMGFMVGTSGSEILKYAKEIENDGEFKKAFILQGIALSTAESLTEMVHHRMRLDWGLNEPQWDQNRGPPRKYRGERFSFGYPACPDMSDQEKLWKLLNPHDIGISLTESHMMEPEASVSCIVYHHPEAKYFGI